MAHKNPIKFLDAYTKEDRDIFFGRDKDTDRLYDTVKRSRVVLLYGLSGTGKTSLVHCGLKVQKGSLSTSGKVQTSISQLIRRSEMSPVR